MLLSLKLYSHEKNLDKEAISIALYYVKASQIILFRSFTGLSSIDSRNAKGISSASIFGGNHFMNARNVLGREMI